jgi:hypothetical protein
MSRRREAPRKRASVALRGLSPAGVGRIKWWLKVLRLGLDVARRRAVLPFGPRMSIALLRRGFMPQSQVVYGLDRNDPRDYVSDRQRELTWTLNWPAAGLLDDKLAFFFMLDHAGIPTPRVYAVIKDGRVHPFDAPGPDGAPERWLEDRLRRSGRLVVKPIRSGGGEGILVLEHAGDDLRLNGEPVSPPALERRLAELDDSLIGEFVEQGAYAQAIFPGTPNSLRVLTLHDDQGGPFLASAVHRFGTTRSVPVDNWSRGGVSAGVDVGSGVLGAAVGLPRDGELVRHDRHPDTGAPIEGVRVPGWERVREGLLELATRTAFLPYVAWDVIVTDGGYAVLEGNKFSALNVMQVHEPLLATDRVRAFYAQQGIL